ncbi:uncharacterized protein LOC122504846 [Leptopilina heterotoma]|uniref:uncharacterized protein LOC122504846 n=1 Tax=Leptopilina heterotoma TaxID=63436 RepID=UPI001CA98411|nr:uncharacterized protein LOC122504846 [Leptopilina heterotoma]
MNQLVQDEEHRYPLAVEPMTKGRYVDDICGGADDLEQLDCVALQLIQLCKAGGFPLAKWKSNHPQLLSSIVSSPESSIEHFFDSSDSKILGLLWISHSDVFKFNLKLTPSTTLTKRSILSEIARIFDPLGLISPIVIQAKVILQSLWLEKLNWDEPLSPRLSQRWFNLQNSLNNLSLITIPRWIHFPSSNQPVQLHGFTDASKVALSAVVYLRSIHQDNVSIRLICAKTKVAPLKPCIIPRLELASCALLVKLVSQVCATLPIPDQEIFLWTDSSVALAWIKDHPSR